MSKVQVREGKRAGSKAWSGNHRAVSTDTSQGPRELAGLPALMEGAVQLNERRQDPRQLPNLAGVGPSAPVQLPAADDLPRGRRGTHDMYLRVERDGMAGWPLFADASSASARVAGVGPGEVGGRRATSRARRPCVRDEQRVRMGEVRVGSFARPRGGCRAVKSEKGP